MFKIKVKEALNSFVKWAKNFLTWGQFHKYCVKNLKTFRWIYKDFVFVSSIKLNKIKFSKQHFMTRIDFPPPSMMAFTFLPSSVWFLIAAREMSSVEMWGIL